MTRTWKGWRSGARTAAVPLAALLACAFTAHAGQSDGGPSAALRRACATGALTAYACAQHGIGATAAPVRTEPPTAAVRPFQDTKQRYSLEIPEGWELKMQGGFAAFAHGDAWIQLRTATAPTAQAAAAAGVELLRSQYAGFQTSADAAVTVGGRPGRRMVMSARSKAGRPSALVVVTAPMTASENLVLIGGGAPADGPAVDGGVAAIARTLHFR